MTWRLSWRADPTARAIADRHYNRQSIGAAQFVPPGRCLVLLAPEVPALWITSWPFGEYVQHRWPGAWVCSCFRKEGPGLASSLIRDAVAVTRWRWPDVPALGMVTFVDAGEVRHKRDPGRCFLRAGFERARDCRDPAHEPVRSPACPACRGETQGGLLAFRMPPENMPESQMPRGAQLSMDVLQLPRGG